MRNIADPQTQRAINECYEEAEKMTIPKLISERHSFFTSIMGKILCQCAICKAGGRPSSIMWGVLLKKGVRE